MTVSAFTLDATGWVQVGGFVLAGLFFVFVLSAWVWIQLRRCWARVRRWWSSRG